MRTGLAVLVLLGIGGCRLQQPGQEEFGTAALTRLSGSAELELRTRLDERTSATEDVRARELWTSQQAGVRAEGFVVHPNLVHLSAGAVLGLFQNDFDRSPDPGAGGDAETDGELVEFDIVSSIFKEKEFPGQVYARRVESLEARPFATSVRRFSNEQGAVWSFLDDQTPSRLSWHRTDLSYDAFDDLDADRGSEDQELGLETAYVLSDRQRFDLEVERSEAKKQPLGLSFDISEAELSHELVFGVSEQHLLESRARVYRQDGTVQLDRSQLLGLLDLEHSETLQTRHVLDLLERTQSDESGGFSVEEQTGSFSSTLDHQLYDNLHTQVGARILDQSFEGAQDLERAEAYLDFDYYRNNPWGLLRVDLRYFVNRSERSGSDPLVVVIDELQTFVDPDPVVLGDPLIDVDSIVITDLVGVTVYQEGLDYSVLAFGGGIEIQRIPTGLILDGQSVLIDYVIESPGAYDLETSSNSVGIRHEFDSGISPYVRWRDQDQRFVGDSVPGVVIEVFTDQVVGVDYRRGNFEARAERTWHDSNVVPYDSTLLSTHYSLDPDTWSRVGAGATWQSLDYADPASRESQNLMLDLTYRRRFGKSVDFDGVLRYLDNRDTLAQDSRGVDLDLGLAWPYRDVDVRLAFEVSHYESEDQDRDGVQLYLQIRRDF